MRAAFLLTSILGLAACEGVPATCTDPARCQPSTGAQGPAPEPSKFGPDDHVVPVALDPNRAQPVPTSLSVSRTQLRLPPDAPPRDP